jgi:hypothetical protein
MNVICVSQIKYKNSAKMTKIFDIKLKTFMQQNMSVYSCIYIYIHTYQHFRMHIYTYLYMNPPGGHRAGKVVTRTMTPRMVQFHSSKEHPVKDYSMKINPPGGHRAVT